MNLIGKGADVNAQDFYGVTALMEVIDNMKYNEIDDDEATNIAKYIEICKILIDNGANVNMKNDRGETALYLAFKNQHKEIFKLLIDEGADVSAKDENGKTILAKCGKYRREMEPIYKEMCKMIVEKNPFISKEEYDNMIIEKIYDIDEYINKGIKKLAIEKCHKIKEELMAYVWNPFRAFTQWALLDEFKEELHTPVALVATAGAGLH